MKIIGITGGTGSGKTTIVNEIVKKFDTNYIKVISQDSYYKDTTHLSIKDREAINFDHPDSIDFKLLVFHLHQLKNNKTIEQPIYDFSIHNRVSETTTLSPSPFLIIEGILIFCHPPLLDLMDLKIYVDADDDERLIRRIKRDVKERGRTVDEVLNRYQTTLKPMHQQFIATSKGKAHVIIPNNDYDPAAINSICQRLKKI